MQRAVTTTGAGFAATANGEFRKDSQYGAHARGEGKAIYQPGAGTLNDRKNFEANVTELLGRGINFSQLSTVNLDRRSGYARATTGLTEAIEGSASVIATTVAAGLLESQDPIKAILTTEVHQQEKIIITRTYVVGGGAEVTPERAPARAVSVKQDVREVYMARYGGDIEMNLNLFLRPEDAKQDLDLKMGAQTLQLDNKLIELGYEAVLSEGTDVVEAIMRSNPAYRFNSNGNERQFEMRLAADRVYCTQIFGALAKHAYSVPNLLAAVKYASAYTLGSIENPVVILPHGAPNLLKYARPEAMRYDVAGIPAASKAPLSMQLDRAFTDPVSGARILVHYPRPAYESGSTQPTVGSGGLSQETTVYTYYYNLAADDWVTDFKSGGLMRPTPGGIATANAVAAVYNIGIMHDVAAFGNYNGSTAQVAAAPTEAQSVVTATGNRIFCNNAADTDADVAAFTDNAVPVAVEASRLPDARALTAAATIRACFNEINDRGGDLEKKNADKWSLYFALTFLEYTRAAQNLYQDVQLAVVREVVASWIAYDNYSDDPDGARNTYKENMVQKMTASAFLQQGDVTAAEIQTTKWEDVTNPAGTAALADLTVILQNESAVPRSVIGRAAQMLGPFNICTDDGLLQKILTSWAIRTDLFNQNITLGAARTRVANAFAVNPIPFADAAFADDGAVQDTFKQVRDMNGFMNIGFLIRNSFENTFAVPGPFPFDTNGLATRADAADSILRDATTAVFAYVSLVAPGGAGDALIPIRDIQMMINAAYVAAEADLQNVCGIPDDKRPFYIALQGATANGSVCSAMDLLAGAAYQRTLLGAQFSGPDDATSVTEYKAAFAQLSHTFLRKTVCQMSSAIVAAPGGKAGRLLVGYPMTGVSTSTATEAARIQLRMYMGAAVTDPESIMILPNVSFEGIISDDFIVPLAPPVQKMEQGRAIDISEFDVINAAVEGDQLAIVHQGATFSRSGTEQRLNSGHFGKLDHPKCYERLWGSQVYSNEL